MLQNKETGFIHSSREYKASLFVLILSVMINIMLYVASVMICQYSFFLSIACIFAGGALSFTVKHVLAPIFYNRLVRYKNGKP